MHPGSFSILKANASLRILDDKCTLLHDSGAMVSHEEDSMVDSHFNSLLEGIITWQNSPKTKDLDLLGELFS